jgi:hypothetical protein
MNFDLASLFPDLEALAPDGRWNLLQSWLKENPEYGERAERWSEQPVDSVYFEIAAMVVNRYGMLGSIALGVPAVKAKLTQTIETLQACYRERAGQTEKEIKNVRTAKDAGRRSTKDHRRTNARAKRTDQT